MPPINKIPATEYYKSPHPAVVAAAPRAPGQPATGTDPTHKNCRVDKKTAKAFIEAPKPIFSGKALLSHIVISDPTNPDPYADNMLAAALYVAKHGAMERLSDGCRKRLALRLAEYVQEHPKEWESFNPETKKIIGIYSMEWYWEADEPFVATCKSIHTGNTYSVTLDPATGETSCEKSVWNPETQQFEGGCTAFNTGKMCYHRACFDVVVRPKMEKYLFETFGIIFDTDTDSCADSRSMFTQERNAESEAAPIGCRVTVAAALADVHTRRETLVKPDEDFDPIPAPYVRRAN